MPSMGGCRAYLGRVILAGRSFDVTRLRVDHPGKGHDRTLVAPGFLGVADGATPLAAEWPDPGDYSDAALSALHAESRTGERATLRVWSNAIRRVAQQTGHRAPSVSCSVAIVRELGDCVEAEVLGDCTVVVGLREAPAVVVTDVCIQELDAGARRSPDPRRAFLAQRERMNRWDGYWIFSSDESAARHVVAASHPVADVRFVLLYSDGLTARFAELRTDPAGIDESAARSTAAVAELVEEASAGKLTVGQTDDIALVYAVCRS
jgi:hypothetical protein